MNEQVQSYQHQEEICQMKIFVKLIILPKIRTAMVVSRMYHAIEYNKYIIPLKAWRTELYYSQNI